MLFQIYNGIQIVYKDIHLFKFKKGYYSYEKNIFYILRSKVQTHCSCNFFILLSTSQFTYGGVSTLEPENVGNTTATLRSVSSDAAFNMFHLNDGREDINGNPFFGYGEFTANVEGLSPNTDYDYYAYNPSSSSGGWVSFTTLPEPFIFGFPGLIFVFYLFLMKK